MSAKIILIGSECKNPICHYERMDPSALGTSTMGLIISRSVINGILNQTQVLARVVECLFYVPIMTAAANGYNFRKAIIYQSGEEKSYVSATNGITVFCHSGVKMTSNVFYVSSKTCLFYFALNSKENAIC